MGRDKVEVEKKEREVFFASYREISPSDLLVPPLNSRIAYGISCLLFEKKYIYIYIYILSKISYLINLYLKIIFLRRNKSV